MRNKVYSIIITDVEKPFNEVLKEYQRELATQIVNRICEAIDNGDKAVLIAKISTPFHSITLRSKEENYIDTLEINKDTLILYEDYELCAKANKAIEKMKEKEKNKKYLEDSK